MNNKKRPPEGEAVTEQKPPTISEMCGSINFGGKMKVDGNNEIYFEAAPVVSTAAPEPSKRDRAIPRTVSLVTCANCDAQVPPAAAGCIRCGANLMIKNSASDTPVAPESYKPAEGPGLITRLRYMGGRLRSELNDAAMLYPTCFHLEAVQQMIAEWDEIAKEAVKTEMAAAPPVTVEAPGKCHPDCVTQIDYITKYSRPDLRGKPCDCGAATPKPIGDVEAAAKTLYEKGFRYEGPVIFACEFGVTAESAQIETIAAILSPFFAPAIVRCHCCGGTQLWQRNKDGEIEVFHDCASGLHAMKERAEKAEAECATLRKERDDARKSLESELHYTNCDKLHRERETKRHWQGRAEAAEAQLSTLRDALKKGDPPTEEELAEWRREIGLSDAGPAEAITWLNEHFGVDGSNSLRETVTNIITYYRGHNIGARFVDREGKSWRLSEIMQAYAIFRAALAPTPEVATVKILRGQRKVSLEIEHESETGTHSIGEVAKE